MNESKRRFIKALPLVALGGVALKIGEHDARANEIKPDRRYVIKIVCDISQQELDGLHKDLAQRGFGDVLLLAGPLEIYEL